MAAEATEQLRAYVEYFRDLGIHEFYRNGEPLAAEEIAALLGTSAVAAAPVAEPVASRPAASVAPKPAPLATASPFGSSSPFAGPPVTARSAPSAPPVPSAPLISRLPLVAPATAYPATPVAAASSLEIPIPKPVPFDQLVALPAERVKPADKAAALKAIQEEIGDCTRCPLAYAGRRKIVFADGDPNAQLMFIGEGPGADEDASGVPFVGKAGQLLNNIVYSTACSRSSRR